MSAREEEFGAAETVAMVVTTATGLAQVAKIGHDIAKDRREEARKGRRTHRQRR